MILCCEVLVVLLTCNYNQLCWSMCWHSSGLARWSGQWSRHYDDEHELLSDRHIINTCLCRNYIIASFTTLFHYSPDHSLYLLLRIGPPAVIRGRHLVLKLKIGLTTLTTCSVQVIDSEWFTSSIGFRQDFMRVMNPESKFPQSTILQQSDWTCWVFQTRRICQRCTEKP